MRSRGRGDGRPQEPGLAALLERVHLARAEVAAQRHAVGSRDMLDRARRDLLAALEAYAEALQQQRLPLPPALHAELLLHRGLYEG